MTSLRSFIKKFFSEREFITVVSGLPRSGTSMMMSALQAGGMELLVDNIRQADASNPKGYFEYERVKKLTKGDSTWMKSAVGKAVKIISALLQFLPVGYHYRILFMERDIDEILASQKQMLLREGKEECHPIADDDLRQSYQEHISGIKTWMAGKKWIRTYFIRYHDVINQPNKIFKEIAAFLDNKVNPVLMADAVDPDLYRERSQGKV